MEKILISFILILYNISLMGVDVSGNQSGVWSPDNNPYNVVGEITIPAEETLEIQPGVIVSVQGYYQITAEGNILAIGAEADSIRFFGFNNLSWGGIRLESETQQSEFYYCYIEDTDDINDYGINSINSPVLVNYCTFENHKKAIHFSSLISTTPSYMEIKNAKIWDCEQNGILITDNSNALVDSCEIMLCGWGTQYRGAIQLALQNSSHDCSPTITNNWIHDNSKQGIIMGNVFNYLEMAPTVENNIIEYNMSGIYLYNAKGYYKYNIIRYNFTATNPDTGAGVMLYGSGASGTFTYNHIYGNYTGFYITTDATANIGDLNNTSTDDDGFNMIHDNVFYTGETYSIYNESAMDVIAENNVWDYDIPIDETIIDGNDNPAYGIVDYEPYLSPFAPPDTIIITEQYECYPWEYAYPTYLIHNSWNIYIDGAFVGNFQYGTYNLLGFGMIPGQSYLIEITLLYDEGESIPADTTFIYNPMILNPPTNVVLNPFLWIIFWEPPEYTSATLTGYNIYLDGVLEAIVDVDVFEYQYSNLIPGQQYTAGVSALYEEGESEIIEDGGWGPYIFNPPTNAFYEIIDDYIHLTWQEPEPGSTHPFLNYRIYVGGELDGETTELFYDIYDLISGQIYLVGLTAFYEYLFESDPIEFEIPYVGISTENILSVTTLHQNYPNPFKPSGAGRNPATTISFNISRKDAKRSPAFDGNAELIIYNIKGQKVKTLVNEVLPSGAHSVVWNGRDSNGNRVGSGIYFYKLQSGKFEEIKKMILLK